MDIANILAEAAEEHYNEDEFEQDEQVVLDDSGHIDTNLTLQLAAQQIAAEDKAETDKIFQDVAEEIGHSASFEKSDPNDDAAAILVEASKEVAQYYGHDHENDEPIVPVAEVELEPESDESESVDEEEDEEEDPHLNAELIVASYREKVDTVKQLLRKGANHFCRDRHGWTPLMWACAQGYNEVAEVLVQHRLARGKKLKKYINAKDTITGWTALHIACVNGHKHTVELLLEHGANKKAKTLLKEFPIDVIGKSSQARNIKLLLES